MIEIKKANILKIDSAFDETAIHRNRSGEIYSLPIKETIDDDDLVLIESFTSSPTQYEKFKVPGSAFGVNSAENIGSGKEVFSDDSTKILKFRTLSPSGDIINIVQSELELIFSIEESNISIDAIGDGVTFKKFLLSEREKLSTIQSYADVTDIDNVTDALHSISITELDDINESGASIDNAARTWHDKGNDTSLGILTEDIDFGLFRGRNASDPILPQDYVTLKYFNDNSGGGFDTDAIHKDRSDEISQITPISPLHITGNERLVLERDSDQSKRSILVSELRNDENTIHIDGSAEFIKAPRIELITNDLIVFVEVPGLMPAYSKGYCFLSDLVSNANDPDSFHYDIMDENSRLDFYSDEINPDGTIWFEDPNYLGQKYKAKISTFLSGGTDDKAIHYDGISEFNDIESVSNPSQDTILIGELGENSGSDKGKKVKFSFDSISQNNDPYAFHSNKYNEINKLSDDHNPHNDDFVLLEKYDPLTPQNRVKKKVRIGDLPSGSGGENNYGINIGTHHHDGKIYAGMDGSGLKFKRLDGDHGVSLSKSDYAIFIKADIDYIVDRIIEDKSSFINKLDLHLKDVSNDSPISSGDWDKKSSEVQHILWTLGAATAGGAAAAATVNQGEIQALAKLIELNEGLIETNTGSIEANSGRIDVNEDGIADNLENIEKIQKEYVKKVSNRSEIIAEHEAKFVSESVDGYVKLSPLVAFTSEDTVERLELKTGQYGMYENIATIKLKEVIVEAQNADITPIQNQFDVFNKVAQYHQDSDLNELIFAPFVAGDHITLEYGNEDNLDKRYIKISGTGGKAANIVNIGDGLKIFKGYNEDSKENEIRTIKSNYKKNRSYYALDEEFM